MVSLDELQPYVKPHLSGMSDPAIERVLIDSAKEFAERTGVIVETISVSVTAGQDIIIPESASADEEVVGVISVDGSAAGFTHYFKSVTLDNQVTKDGVVELECWMRPKYKVDSLNEVLANNYREGIVSGAIYRGKMIPGDQFDPQGANTHFQLFEKAVSQAKYDMATRRSAQNVTKNQPRFV